MREERVSFANCRGETLVGVLHHADQDPGGGAVILCHGMDSNKTSEKLVFLSRELARRGVLALRFDFSYAGESSGKFEEITYSGEVDDLKAAYKFLKDRHGSKTALLGSSMGGTVALMFAAQEPEVAALVTVSAPLHPENFPGRILTAGQLWDWRRRGFILYNGRRFNASLLEDLESINVEGCARKVACPVLVLHGDADSVVPVEEAYQLYDCLMATKRLSILPGADHQFSNPEMMGRAVNEALDWLTRHVE
jgi:putative redox protein